MLESENIHMGDFLTALTKSIQVIKILKMCSEYGYDISAVDFFDLYDPWMLHESVAEVLFVRDKYSDYTCIALDDDFNVITEDSEVEGVYSLYEYYFEPVDVRLYILNFGTEDIEEMVNSIYESYGGNFYDEAFIEDNTIKIRSEAGDILMDADKISDLLDVLDFCRGANEKLANQIADIREERQRLFQIAA